MIILIVSFTDPTYRHSSLSIESQTHNILSTVRGYIDRNGGVLSCNKTGVSIIIPAGALTEKQEIYFKVCQDSEMLPLDKEKG